jgi:hypothetical protein
LPSRSFCDECSTNRRAFNLLHFCYSSLCWYFTSLTTCSCSIPRTAHTSVELPTTFSQQIGSLYSRAVRSRLAILMNAGCLRSSFCISSVTAAPSLRARPRPHSPTFGRPSRQSTSDLSARKQRTLPEDGATTPTQHAKKFPAMKMLFPLT